MLAETLSDKPGASVPGACADRAETVAAYRLLANEDVSWRDVLEAHGQATVRRMSAEAVVLCLQDTTELDYLSAPTPVVAGLLFAHVGVAGAGRARRHLVRSNVARGNPGKVRTGLGKSRCPGS